MATLIPQRLIEVTAPWLTRALYSSGALKAGEVTAVQAQPFGVGVGLMSAISRVRLKYSSNAAPTLPATMVVKLSATTPNNREMAIRFGLYEREVRFYRELATDIGFQTPVAYFAAHDPHSDLMALILEDVEAEPSAHDDSRRNTSDDDVRFIVAALASFHARWWIGSGRRHPDWVPRLDGATWSGQQRLFQSAWAALAEQNETKSQRDFVEFGRRLVAVLPALQRRLTTAPATLVHFDFRRANLILGHSNGERKLWVVDWQPLSVARGPYDLAYFLTQSLTVEQRRRLEHELLDIYTEGLCGGGVRGYNTADVWQDYRLGAAYTTNYAVGTILVDLGNGIGDRYATDVLARAEAAVGDLELSALIGSFR